MKKIRLELDSLNVESFEVSDAPAEHGTVQAHAPEPASNARCNSEWSCRDTCYFLSCLDTQCYCNVNTYADSCGCDPYVTVYYQTCQNTCYGTCTCTNFDPNNTCTCTC